MKALHQDTVLPPGAQPCAAATGAAKGSPGLLAGLPLVLARNPKSGTCARQQGPQVRLWSSL